MKNESILVRKELLMFPKGQIGLWILLRKPKMPECVKDQLCAR